MELDPQEKSRAWWHGTWKGAAKGLLVGLAVGAATALMLHFVLIPVLPLIGLPSIANAFAGFLTLSPGLVSGWAGGVVPTAFFSTVPLAIFSGVSGMIGNMLSGGAAAVSALEQKKQLQWQQTQDGKIAQLESREPSVQTTLTLPRSRAVKSIIAQGPRQTVSFADTETARAIDAPTIHR